MSGTFYGREHFDAQLIISQMCVMQALHYLALGASFFLMDSLMGVPISLDQFFTSNVFENMSTRLAWATVFSVFLCALCDVGFLYVVVERAKKCLDFGTTLYGFHILICFFYDGLPTHWVWWFCNILATILTVLTGEYVCARREMRDITIVRGV
eukprot:759250-Hanusia_phi.AAC.6